MSKNIKAIALIPARSGSKRIIDKMQKAKAFDLGAVSKCTCLQDCDNCGAKQVQFISTGNEVCPKCFC